MSVEEVMAKTLPDVLAYNLDILIVSLLPRTMMLCFADCQYLKCL